MKYSRTLRPSRKFALIGRSMMRPLRVGHQAAHTGHLLDLGDVALRAGVGHQVDSAVVAEVLLDDLGKVVVGLGPDRDGVLVALLVL